MEILDDEERKNDAVFPKCNDCIYMTDDADCPAWPEGIPDNVFFNDTEHDHVFPGQVGKYVFTPRS